MGRSDVSAAAATGRPKTSAPMQQRTNSMRLEVRVPVLSVKTKRTWGGGGLGLCATRTRLSELLVEIARAGSAGGV
jgi:hypothetical protein